MAKAGRKPIADKHDYRFSVPGADADVIAWIEAQDNLGVSLRCIIKASVQKDGIVDVFCKPIPNPGVSAGRPKSAETHETVAPKTEKKVEAVSEAKTNTNTSTDVDTSSDDMLASLLK